MGLDMYLYKINNAEEFKQCEDDLDKMYDNRENMLDELFAEFADLGSDILTDFYKNAKTIEKQEHEKFIIFNLENKDGFEKLTYKFLNYIEVDLAAASGSGHQETAEIKRRVSLTLFNIFPIFDTENQEIKNKLTDLFIDYARKIENVLDDRLKEKIITVFEMNNELEKLEEKIENIKSQAVYWRKANQIHNWFYRNVAFKYDDIQSEIFNGEELVKLKNDIEKVLDLIHSKYDLDDKNIHIDENDSIYKKIMKILPPVSGFFFGSTDIDRHYVNDLKYTLDELNKLDPKKTESFYYYASY